MTRPYAVIDIDGVLADVRHRLHHLASRPKNWDAFFATMQRDTPYAEGFALARTLADDHQLVYLSGRPERTRDVTQTWLADHDAPPGQLILRPDHDRRPARLFKLGVIRRLASSAPVGVVVDDDVQVCQIVRAAGFPVRQADWADASRVLHEAQEVEGTT